VVGCLEKVEETKDGNVEVKGPEICKSMATTDSFKGKCELSYGKFMLKFTGFIQNRGNESAFNI
jgi:hypothetical protein